MPVFSEVTVSLLQKSRHGACPAEALRQKRSYNAWIKINSGCRRPPFQSQPKLATIRQRSSSYHANESTAPAKGDRHCGHGPCLPDQPIPIGDFSWSGRFGGNHF